MINLVLFEFQSPFTFAENPYRADGITTHILYGKRAAGLAQGHPMTELEPYQSFPPWFIVPLGSRGLTMCDLNAHFLSFLGPFPCQLLLIWVSSFPKTWRDSLFVQAGRGPARGEI